MTSEQIIEIGKTLLPYLRADLRPEELGMAAHDAMAAFNRFPARQMLVERATKIERERCAKIAESSPDATPLDIANAIRSSATNPG